MRYKFWLWAHNRAESLWHWIYYSKLVPLQPPIKVEHNKFYRTKVEHDNDSGMTVEYWVSQR